MKNLMAVYGTLRQGCRLHYAMEGAEKVGEDYVEGFEMYDYCGGSFPFIIKGAGKIKVELYFCDAKIEQQVDDIELGAGYKKGKVATKQGEAIIYYREKPYRFGDYTFIRSGDWKKYYKEKFNG